MCRTGLRFGPMRRDTAETEALARPFATEVEISAGGVTLAGTLAIPRAVRGLVIFAHGSGSSRFSPRNRSVAHHLQAAGFGTLLFDLLTEAEEHEEAFTGHLRFDIGFLARRLTAVADWARTDSRARHLPLGFFGASTGAAAALVSAADQPEGVRAVVSRGGRPDLADEALPRVTAPTLLIVGGRDDLVLPLNAAALARLRCPKRLEIVPGATHLFAEPGALETVARLAADWFAFHLPLRTAQSGGMGNA